MSLTTAVTSTLNASATATGTTAVNSRCDLSNISTNTYVTSVNETCIDISLSANVSTSMLENINALGVGCNYLSVNQELCLLGICDIYLVQSNDTCALILSTLSRQVSLLVFRAWNPNPKCSRSAVPKNTVTTSNDDCGYWYTIQDGDTCDNVTAKFDITSQDFYFLNPQLGGKCSNLWEGNSYCVEAVGNIQTYAGYSTTSRSAYTTLASTFNLNATATDNWNMTAYYNVSSGDLTSEMLDDAAWLSEYDRVCLIDVSQPLPTQPFNISISLGDPSTTQFTSSTIFYTTSTALTGQLSTKIAQSTTTTATNSESSSTSTTSSSSAEPSSTGLRISPDGTCGESYGYTCAGSQFGDCCDNWGYWYAKNLRVYYNFTRSRKTNTLVQWFD
ncbi:hypothetical protein N7495_000030 [Penicillium taxi]|uniref:uncharacterized protein n=1 Tax=Penicillium taxi TaxID=168475 RepID=UPI0025457FA1|nr:uncharacterized protein N7495_000030 [Penicillium taxi]KAJ5907348.1 hypothetical protein N7495_000030 [Penicillium taxi]